MALPQLAPLANSRNDERCNDQMGDTCSPILIIARTQLSTDYFSVHSIRKYMHLRQLTTFGYICVRSYRTAKTPPLAEDQRICSPYPRAGSASFRGSLDGRPLWHTDCRNKFCVYCRRTWRALPTMTTTLLGVVNLIKAVVDLVKRLS
jgi:hypothetical protein